MGHGRTGKEGAGTGGWKPVLGLSDEPGERLPFRGDGNGARGTVFDQPEPEELIELTVIVPARNEQDCLGGVPSVAGEPVEEIFELGKDWELMVVDDQSTDARRKLRADLPGSR
jgi:hypothetical protein